MKRNGWVRKIAVVGGTVAALALTTAPLGYAEQPGDGVRYGDVDGDGVADRLTLQRATDGVWSVRADLADGTTSAVPLGDDGLIPDVGIRVTDVNSDGVDEVVAPTFVGANTITFAMVVHRAGVLAPVTGTDGSPFRLYEGGGVAAVNGYDCPADHDGRVLDVVGATLQDGPATLYEGQRTTYVVDDGVATPVYVADIRDAAAGDGLLATDPDSCAPTG